jgi:hypothetical protein
MNGALIGGVVDTPETTKAGVSHCLQSRPVLRRLSPSINTIIAISAQPPRPSTNPTPSTAAATTQGKLPTTTTTKNDEPRHQRHLRQRASIPWNPLTLLNKAFVQPQHLGSLLLCENKRTYIHFPTTIIFDQEFWD